MISEQSKKLLEKQHYALVGNHSACKICHWTKESIRGNNFCYKQKFYGIESHRCLQMTPAVDYCTHKCIFCWRAIDYTCTDSIPANEVDDPKEMLDNLIRAQRKLLIGFKGSESSDKKKLNEAMDPNQVAISLSGEPTLYPKLSEFIQECKSRSMTTFLVTNGTKPEVLENLDPEPTQLYLSLDSPNKELYKKIDLPQIKNGWNRIHKTIQLFPSFSCKTVIRLTLLKQNMKNPAQYSDLIEQASPKYIECKAYMHIGSARKRLPRTEMPEHSEIMDFAKELQNNTSYRIIDQKPDSRVALLTK